MKVQQFANLKDNRLVPLIPNRKYEIPQDRFVIREQSSIRILLKRDILFCQSSSNYTIINFENGERIVLSKCLKQIEQQLCDPNFMRIHASFLVNLDYLLRINLSPSKTVLLQNQISLPISKSRFPALTKLFTIRTKR